jgi:membrane protein DedA with SNARE-associated domain
MAWSIEGTYMENCPCDSVCPCTTSELTQRADTERCQVLLAFHVERGDIEGTDVGGLTAVMVADAPALMSEGGWKMGLIIDSAANEEQAAKLEAVMSGQLGGMPGALVELVGESLGTERAQIDYVDDGPRHRVRIGDQTSIEIEDFVSPATNETVKITGLGFPGVLHSLEPALNHYGYLAVAGPELLEDFGVPVPGETILILGAVYAGAGRLNVFLVGLLAFVAAVIGDNIGFAIGHFGGRRLVERFGRYILLTPERLDKATGFFERQETVAVARFIEGLGQANGIIAGITGMHWAKFLAFSAPGAALRVAVWTSVGYFSGRQINSIYNTTIRYDTYLAFALGALALAYIALRLWRLRLKRARDAT